MTEEAVEGDVKNVLVYERRKDVFYPWLCTATLLEFVYVKQPVVVDGNLNVNCGILFAQQFLFILLSGGVLYGRTLTISKTTIAETFRVSRRRLRRS